MPIITNLSHKHITSALLETQYPTHKKLTIYQYFVTNECQSQAILILDFLAALILSLQLNSALYNRQSSV